MWHQGVAAGLTTSGDTHVSGISDDLGTYISLARRGSYEHRSIFPTPGCESEIQLYWYNVNSDTAAVSRNRSPKKAGSHVASRLNRKLLLNDA